MKLLLVALDYPNVEQALKVARMVRPHVGGFKVGLELIWSDGPSAVSRIVSLGLPVMIDAKLHDIPNTVRRAARQINRLGGRWVTLHATGGQQMMEAAVEGLGDDGGGILAVTVLTSLGPTGMASVGLEGPLAERVADLTAMASAAGVEGVVCSVDEVPVVKRCADHLLAVTPGIRVAGATYDDQVRVATPAEALAAGADVLVVGRPITRAENPAAAAEAIAAAVTWGS